MTYTQIPLQHISRLHDGDLIHITGIYTRDLEHAVLTAGDKRLQLIGIPFTYIPRQQARVEIWGRRLQGKPPRLHVHDARPVGALAPAPHPSDIGKAGDQLALTVHVRCVGDDQIATTPDGYIYVLLGEELDQRHYSIVGRVISLQPPMLEVTQAVPFTQVAPFTRDW